ncbi:response regulator, partial [bacterium]|nr:response regulator [bacterium]
MDDSLKILVVEDDQQVQEFMSTILEIEGCKNDTAFTGSDAIDYVKRADYDLVFLDLEIPEIHGLDVLSKIKALHPVTKSVILTGYASKESAIRALKEGAYDFIEKPFSIHQITRIVQNIKEEKKLERENDRLLRELKQTKNFLENIHSNIGAGIIVCLEDGKIISHNYQAAKIWETGEEILHGKNLGEISSDK